MFSLPLAKTHFFLGLPRYLSLTVAQTLEVFALESGHWLLLANHGGNEVVRAVPFDADELRLERADQSPTISISPLTTCASSSSEARANRLPILSTDRVRI